MNLTRVLIIIGLFIVTFFITNTPDFHLDGLIGLRSSTATDIMSHASYYFIITFPIFILLNNTRIPVFFICFLLFIPAIFEFSQAFVPGRSVSAYDMLGNYIGIISGLSICFLCRYLINRKLKFKP
jgi:VanZ family protein